MRSWERVARRLFRRRLRIAGPPDARQTLRSGFESLLLLVTQPYWLLYFLPNVVDCLKLKMLLLLDCCWSSRLTKLSFCVDVGRYYDVLVFAGK